MKRTLLGLIAFFTGGIAAADTPPFIAAEGVVLWVVDGQVFASGADEAIRGDSDENNRTVFKPIAGLSDIVSVYIGPSRDAAAAIDKNGRVWMWGYVWAKRVHGNGATGKHHVPGQLADVADAKAIAIGANHLVVLHHDGTVSTVASDYDANDQGQMGTGNTEAPKTPFKIPHIDDAIAVAAGEYSTFILRSDGTVWAMGDKSVLGNSVSLLGLEQIAPDRMYQTVAAPIPGLSGIVQIDIGHRFGIALDKRGQVWGWGYNDSGQIGMPETDMQTFAPRKLRQLPFAKSISAGYDFTLALDAKGRVHAQGCNVHGVLGSKNGELAEPARIVPGVTGATSIVAGSYNAFARLSDGSVVGWGSNDSTGGGFHPTADRVAIPPVKLDHQAKPSPPSNIIAAGGVKVLLTLSLDDSYYQQKSIDIKMDGKTVASLTATAKNDEVEKKLEIPAGSHRYEIVGEAILEDGSKRPIQGSSALIVSKVQASQQLDKMTKELGLIGAIKKFQAMIAEVDPQLNPKSLTLKTSPAMSDEELDAIELKLGRPLPPSYRAALKTIGPFQLGHPDSPYPVAALYRPDAKRNVDTYVSQLLADHTKTFVDAQHENAVTAMQYMKPFLSSVKQDRTHWHKNLIGAVYDDTLYMLVGHSSGSKKDPYPELWSNLYAEQNDGESYFGWSELCGEADETVSDDLTYGTLEILMEYYRQVGVAPLWSDSDDEKVYASIKDAFDDYPSELKVLPMLISSDGW